MENQKLERLGSLDVLRGFDLFCLVFFQPILIRVANALDWVPTYWVASNFYHSKWNVFTFWDIIMPLFMFMAGASMPFAFARHLQNGTKLDLYKRILKRVVLLWIFGMMCQGNLLSFDPDRIFLFSNTLQSIAVGYLIAAVLLIHLKRNGQIIVTASLLLIYWGIMTFVKVGYWGGGNFSPDNNLAEYIDRIVLGRFRDGSTITETGIDFGKYRYTWILSSLNFGVTVMTGVFAGQILKSSLSKIRKMQWLVVGGVLMIIAGQLWGLQMPIIKKIWTSSMTLFSSGICFLLMALFYFLIDYKKYGKYFNWLKIYGMNSILAYMLYEIINFSSVTTSVLHGTEQFLGNYYEAVLKLGKVSIIFLILWLLYRRRIFLKV
jgi:predicted acyltransferase